MDTRPIGFFDSGVGGLTVAKEIYSLLPHESTVYIGDTARIPYGPRSKETVTHFSKQLVKFLLTKNVKLIVVACSTASAQALETLQNELEIPIIGVIEPTVQTAAQATKSNHIIILGTKGTVNSGAFIQAIKRHNPQIQIEQQACPLFVPLIEEGIASGPVLEPILDLYLNKFKSTAADQLILGCTHYPVIEASIKKYLNNPSLKIANPGVTTAKTVKDFLEANSLNASTEKTTSHEYFTTDKPELFLSIAQNFLGRPIHEHTQQINIDQY